MDTSMENFSNWFLQNRFELLTQARKWKKDNIQLEKEFLIEWPLERNKIMELDEYIIGKGPENKSLCYELEFGKYRGLYLSIKGGSSAKFGIYWSKKHHAYCDKINQPIPELKLRSEFEKLKTDLIAILEAGVAKDFGNSAFSYSNSFFTRSSLITNLLCIYADLNSYSGINMSLDEAIWGNLCSIDRSDSVYRQNHELTKLMIKNFPELDSYLLSSMLWKYRDYVLKC